MTPEQEDILKAEQTIRDAGGTINGKEISLPEKYSKDLYEMVDWLMFEHNYQLSKK